jgi:hypothetical protein
MSDSITKTEQLAAVAVLKYDLLITAGAAVVSTGVTVEPIGIAMDAAGASERVLMCVSGKCKARASAAISQYDILMPAAAGEVTTHDDDAGSVKIGVALEAAGAANDHIDILLFANKTIADA